MIDGMGKIERGSKLWPKGLLDLGKQEPKQLWYEGKWDGSLWKKCAAVVGSRRMTQYGRQVLQKIIPRLVNDGWTIVSGMMYGVDQTAHKLCMECGGRTVGVLGWGIKYQLLSDEDMKLLKQITETGGLVISEWEEQAGTLWTFPLRDRIMAALASDIYIVEAAVKSGSLITADWGIKLGRKIWAVPGPVTSRVSEGTNSLIGQGLAKPWLGLEAQTPCADRARSTNEANIYSMLECEALTVNGLAKALKKPVQEVAAELSMMELRGELVVKEGKYYPEK
jgi:DNA processing protein